MWDRKSHEERGILVATDQKLEWLLPWWWKNYSAENSLPVTFVDFGMSEEARDFCAERGELISFAFSSTFMKAEEQLAPEITRKHGEKFWEARKSWFQKPLALLQTRFKQTLWLDLDCEVLRSLLPIFENFSSDFGVVREPMIRQGSEEFLLGETLYNAGVVLYRHGSPLVERWAEECFHHNDQHLSDQSLLSRLIFQEKYPIQELPETFNARLTPSIPIHATVIHWVGSWGKEYIRKHGGLREMLTNLTSKR